MKSIFYSVRTYITAALILASFATPLFAQKIGKTTVKNGPVDVVAAPNAAVSPVVFDGQNITCANLNASTNLAFSHIITNNELKLNFADPNGSYSFANNANQVLVGPQNVSGLLTVSSSSNPGTVHSWSSQAPITAIIVKVGNTSYVYPYKPFSMGDSGLATGDSRGISHLTVCFEAFAGPTAADVSVSGRVVDANGVGLSRAQMVLVNGETGETKITLTSPFGYYIIEGVDVGKMYVLNVNHKQHNFAESQRVVSPTDSMTNVDFVAMPVNY